MGAHISRSVVLEDFPKRYTREIKLTARRELRPWTGRAITEIRMTALWVQNHAI